MTSTHLFDWMSIQAPEKDFPSAVEICHTVLTCHAVLDDRAVRWRHSRPGE
jgi:hypothetical protein